MLLAQATLTHHPNHFFTDVAVLPIYIHYYYMQYIPCNSALLAQEALFLPKRALFLPKDLKKKVRKLRQILIRDKIAYVRA